MCACSFVLSPPAGTLFERSARLHAPKSAHLRDWVYMPFILDLQRGLRRQALTRSERCGQFRRTAFTILLLANGVERGLNARHDAATLWPGCTCTHHRPPARIGYSRPRPKVRTPTRPSRQQASLPACTSVNTTSTICMQESSIVPRLLSLRRTVCPRMCVRVCSHQVLTLYHARPAHTEQWSRENNWHLRQCRTAQCNVFATTPLSAVS